MLWNFDQGEALIAKRCPAWESSDHGVACRILHALCNGEHVAFELRRPSTLSGLSEHEFALVPRPVVRKPDPLNGRYLVPGSDSNQHRGPEDGFGLSAERAPWMKA
jgi:hypothetical protein